MPYASEKLTSAVVDLACGHQPLKDRLIRACQEHISVLSDRDFSTENADDFRAIKRIISREETRGNEGSIAASINAIPLDEAYDLAENICNLAFDVLRERR